MSWSDEPYREVHTGELAPSRSGLVAVVAAIASGLVVGGLHYYHEHYRGSAARVPAVVGLTLSAARGVAAEQGLALEVLGLAPDDLVVKGAVAQQAPLAGTAVAPGNVVEVVLSDGPARTTVPPLSRASLAEAHERLRGQGLTVGAVREETGAEVPVGAVLGSEPPAGTAVSVGTAVTVLTAAGPVADGGVSGAPDGGPGVRHPSGPDR
ncbi:MAG: PASTA domain-containing protein [Deltaproteobacteria bacterium]|nr:PASTA domain-containing protein [Deltaproteobacteria bacterium]